MTQTQAVEFIAVGKDRLSDPWVTRHFTDRSLAQRWVDARAFVLPGADGTDIRVNSI